MTNKKLIVSKNVNEDNEYKPYCSSFFRCPLCGCSKDYCELIQCYEHNFVCCRCITCDFTCRCKPGESTCILCICSYGCETYPNANAFKVRNEKRELDRFKKQVQDLERQAEYEKSLMRTQKRNSKCKK